MLNKIGISYIRVSTEEQAQEGRHSLNTQEHDCKELAKGKSYEIVRMFGDPSKSGGDSNRPGLLEMLDYIKHNKVDALFIQHTDRLARDVILHHQIMRELRKANVELYTVSQGKIEDTPEGKMVDGMLAVSNEYQRNITSYKTKKSVLEKAKGGWLPGEAPYGYKNIGIGEDGRVRIIVIDKNTSKYVLMAFKMFATGRYPVEELRDILTAKGMKSKRGVKMSCSKLNYILKNPFYIGEMHWGGVHLLKAQHKPLINRDLFNAIQRIFADHNHHACRRRKYQYLLRGFAYCICGARMTACKFKNKTKDYYFCLNRKNCDEHYIPMDDLENKAKKLFQYVQFSDSFIDLVIKRIKVQYQEIKAFNNGQRQELINQKTALEQKRNKAEEKLLDGILSDEDFSRIKIQLNGQLNEIESQIFELNSKREIKIDQIQTILNFTRNIYEAYIKALPELKKRYLGLFFDKLIISDEKIKRPVLNPIFAQLLVEQKVFYKTQKPFLSEMAFVTPSGSYQEDKVQIRNEWGE